MPVEKGKFKGTWLAVDCSSVDWELECFSSRATSKLPPPRWHVGGVCTPAARRDAPRSLTEKSSLNPNLHMSSHYYTVFHFLFVFHLEVKFSIPDFNPKKG